MENEKLLRKLAWSFHATTKIDLEDLYQEACYAYIKALKSHDPQKAMLSTHITHCVRNHLINYTKKEMEHNFNLLTWENKNDVPYSKINLFEMLTKDAYEVALEALKLKAPSLRRREYAQKDIYKSLRKKGWEVKDIKKTFSELSCVFS